MAHLPSPVPASAGPSSPESRAPAQAAHAFSAALRAQNGGAPAEAIELYFAALLADPLRADAALNLGSLFRKLGWHDYAELFYEQALRTSTGELLPVIHFNIGNLLHAQKRWSQALRSYQRAIELDPSHHGMRRRLVEVALELHEADLAASHLEPLRAHDRAGHALLRARLAALTGMPADRRTWSVEALRLNPASVPAWEVLAAALPAEDGWRDMLDLAREIIRRRPELSDDIVRALLSALCARRHFVAVEMCLVLLAPRSSQPAALYEQICTQLHAANEFRAVGGIYRHLDHMVPASPELLELAGICLARAGDYRRAHEAMQRALELAPHSVQLLCNISNVYVQENQLDAAIAYAERALQLAPQDPDVHLDLALLLNQVCRPVRAGNLVRQGLALPGLPLLTRAGLLHTAAHSELLQSHVAASLDLCRKAAEIAPDEPIILASAAFNATYSEHTTAADLVMRHERIAEAYMKRTDARRRFCWDNQQDPNRKLRLGIPSADLQHHPVGLLLASWIPYLSRDDFEVCFYDVGYVRDATTSRLQAAAQKWHDVQTDTASDLADRIAADGIDILLDVGGYTHKSPIEVFALKPAPVQLSWAGYVFSTRLPTMDGVICDRHTAPPGTESYYSEALLRLTTALYCYEPHGELPPVQATPALTHPHITFGCFNHLPKLSDYTLDLWSRVLEAVPRSRLYIKSGPLAEAEMQNALRNRFLRRGITSDRLILDGPSHFIDYLKAYDQVDIALDAAPFNGGMTTLQGLWQGVPVLTRCGHLPAGRVGASLMHSLGLSSWVAGTDDEFVARAVDKAADIIGLDRTRQEMRARLRACATGNGRLFASAMAHLLRAQWRRWCRSAS